jgi:hypothetical protein
MCSAIEYLGKRYYFKDDEAALPVLLTTGQVEMVRWGQSYADKTPTFLPGACARLDSVHKGKWDRYWPRPVKIEADKFMERDSKRQEHWFPVPHGGHIQGLLASNFEDGGVLKDQVVYVVTVPAPEELERIHDRWPRIVE